MRCTSLPSRFLIGLFQGLRGTAMEGPFPVCTPHPTDPMSTTRIKYLDMDECPNVAFNELLVVGIFCMGIPFGVWWLGCLLFEWLGWESFYGVFHVAGFVFAFLFAVGLTYGAKNTATAASYGALFLDAALVALFFWIVRGQFWTLWTIAALIGLAIHFAGTIPVIARFRAVRDRKEEEDGLRKAAEMLVERGADPAEVEKAVEEVRSGQGTDKSVAWFELLKNLRRKARKLIQPKTLPPKKTPLSVRQVPMRLERHPIDAMETTNE